MVRKTSDVKDVGTSATLIYKITPSKIAKLKKIWAYNSSSSDVTLYFCKSDGTRRTPDIKVLAGQTVFIGEVDVPSVEFDHDIYAVASATGVKVQIEVEES